MRFTTSASLFLATALLYTAAPSPALQAAKAVDKGFRYRSGRCVNDAGQAGLNPGFFGQCGDLRNVILGRLNMDDVDFSGAQFTNADLQQSSLNRANLTGASFEAANLSGVALNRTTLKSVNFKGAILKNTQMTQAMIEACDFSDTDMTGIILSGTSLVGSQFSNTDLTEAKFDGADLTDVQATGANFLKADFTGAKLIRLNAVGAKFNDAILNEAQMNEAIVTSSDFRNAQAVNAQLASADFEKSNLRGTNMEGAKYNARSKFRDATYNVKTVLPFNGEKAKDFGMILKAGAGKVLILRDQAVATNTALETAIKAAGMDATISTMDEYAFTGVGLEEFGAVIHMNGLTYDRDMAAAGQAKLVEFVRRGGIFIGSAWSGYEVSNGRMAAMRDLVLIMYTGGSSPVSATYTVNSTMKSHPIFEDMPDAFTVENCGFTSGPLFTFSENPAQEVVKLNGATAGVAVRQLGEGRVIDLAITGNYQNGTCWSDTNITKIVINALNWN